MSSDLATHQAGPHPAVVAVKAQNKCLRRLHNQRRGLAYSVLKCESTSRFQAGEGPLRDCEIFANLRLKL